nr:bacteriocin BlpQ/BlpM fusion protein [synthetic construct]
MNTKMMEQFSVMDNEMLDRIDLEASADASTSYGSPAE